ncbi:MULTISPECIES: DNA integrity scanning diadenylate cyclase DisA [unclassified Candidatus Frackibacter]|uniref:DNA integrity scanning diadenylate cyclase DisA n=1 Tax=unclassified Candidatus Frackibacter TaxID=2648818 RepID=UPI00087EEE20|nr:MULTISPECIES: DNA integrity scanning diadenylate cyclase DisA [unclassified Candidatus Frackibacter]SDC21200.1 diadenylate cyclase [Candidatus Frackibacter sp. WG11]SEM50613.1 diadenylate cyclase [Candidatus Frackibacter sp. WG12]SFL51982.1 diadenylate cyclase [Candidatus Frackibacter sp. WG13]
MQPEQEGFREVLKFLAPGTPFREGLENILRAKTGGLIVVGDSEEVLGIVDGGFNINSELTSARLYELAKMDGAIVLSSDCKRILCANAQLVPDPSISSMETGTRHRTAERVAKQTGELVISISQRRDIISLYKDEQKYVLEDIRVILAKANQAIQTLEKYRSVLDQTLNKLSALEFQDLVTISDVTTVLQRTEMVLRIGKEIERYINELGTEGRLINMQLEELLANVKDEGILLIKDYITQSQLDLEEDVEEEAKEEIEDSIVSPEEILDNISDFASDDLVSLTTISKKLGYGGNMSVLDLSVSPRGYRLLRKIPRLPMPVIENLIKAFDNFQEVLNASIDELDDVDGVGEVRAQAIKEGLKRLRDQALLEQRIYL